MQFILYRRESEPQLFDAIRFGTVVENVVYEVNSRAPQVFQRVMKSHACFLSYAVAVSR